MFHQIRWTAKKIEQRLQLIEPLVYRRRAALPPFRYTDLPDPLTPPPVGPEVDDSQWPAIEPETYWGQWLTNFTLRTHFQVPADWPVAAPVALYLPLGESGDFSHPETLAYIDGQPYAACDRHHQEFLLSDEWRDGRSHLLALHGWTGLGGSQRNELCTKLFMRPCFVVQIDQPTRDFIATARVALGVAKTLENEPAKGHLLNALDEAFKILDTREPFGEAFYASVAPAQAALRAGIVKGGPPLDVDITAAGHAHIDVAWLWTLGQTRRKAERTFHTVVRLMEQFPDYHFSQSQPQLYEFIRQDQPALFEVIKQRVAQGRWEALGGMWVEADCNLSGPESLARQFLLGRAFFREHFGPNTDSPVLWLPDVFGYAWNLPQLIKQAGLEYFMTIKIGWNQYNRLPFDSFWWQGLDGTRVLTHFSTTPDLNNPAWASTYNGQATSPEALGAWTNFKQKELQQDLLMIFGYGDGGGGPTRDMLENVREMAAFPATPRVKHGKVGDFFCRLEATSADRLPTWNGELYLELHRGTYTSQSRNKRANRQSEFLLHDAEFLSTLAARLDPAYPYPAETLRQAWQLVCLNQFHDIIPGSSIGPVYAESQQQYRHVRELATSASDTALRIIAQQMGGDLLLINPTSFVQNTLACWPGQLAEGQILTTPDGAPVLTQNITAGVLIAAGELPPYSVTPLRMANSKVQITNSPSKIMVSPDLLENDWLRVELNADGDITRIYDKANRREVLPPGAVANQWQAFEDRPTNWDAWDIDIFFDDKMWPAGPATSVQVVEAGPLRATLEIRRRILHSDYTQRVSLVYNSPRLDFDTTINWRERHILLKAAFPIEILAPMATYEVQWGNVQRPTHRNTSWDWARFETCAQKWVDLSEGDYGVSLLNDCKYGHDIQANVIRLSLLRSPTRPDFEADQGEHHFAYSLLPHAGSWNETTIAAAYALNDPLRVVEGANRQGASALSFISVDRPNVVIETIKQAEDGQGIIVRLYESQRQRGEVTLKTNFGLKQVWQTNLLEENQAALTPSGDSVRFLIKPYQIVTLRLLPG